jgi:hypothetical protein
MAAKNWFGALAAVAIGWVAFSTSDPSGSEHAASADSLEAASLSCVRAGQVTRLTCQADDSSANGPPVGTTDGVSTFRNAPGLGSPFATGSPPTAAIAASNLGSDGTTKPRFCSDAIPVGCR